MSVTKLVSVRSYFEPEVFYQMEEIRTKDPRFRRISRSKFVEDCVLECLRRLNCLDSLRLTGREENQELDESELWLE